MSNTKIAVKIGVNVCERLSGFVNVGRVGPADLGFSTVNFFCRVHNGHNHVHRVNLHNYKQVAKNVNIVNVISPDSIRPVMAVENRLIMRLQEDRNFRSQCSQRSRKEVMRLGVFGEAIVKTNQQS